MVTMVKNSSTMVVTEPANPPKPSVRLTAFVKEIHKKTKGTIRSMA